MDINLSISQQSWRNLALFIVCGSASKCYANQLEEDLKLEVCILSIVSIKTKIARNSDNWEISRLIIRCEAKCESLCLINASKKDLRSEAVIG
jgi:hypothetical protein